MGLTFLALPTELVSHILSFLDSTPNSIRNSRALPRFPEVSPNSSWPLKEVSKVCSRLRKIVLPQLFRHVLLKLGQLDKALAFISTNDLSIHVATAHISLTAPNSHQQPPWWAILLDGLPYLTTITITAPPNVFAEITQTPVKLQDAWAYRIECQTFQLSYTLPRSSNHTFPPQPSASLLTARPWTTLHVNEASSLFAYTTYEYFLRTPPCPLPSPSALSNTGTALASNGIHLVSLFTTLRHFHFTAIFPTYNHVADITRLAEKYMPNLESITFQILPHPDSTVLQDTLDATGHHIDVNDPWNEFETSLVLLGESAVVMSQRGVEEEELARKAGGEQSLERKARGLTRMEIVDIQMDGIRERIEEVIAERLDPHPELGWRYNGEGVWLRRRAEVVVGSAKGG